MKTKVIEHEWIIEEVDGGGKVFVDTTYLTAVKAPGWTYGEKGNVDDAFEGSWVLEGKLVVSSADHAAELIKVLEKIIAEEEVTS